ncbi:DUF2306 domain-containing protein [Pontibacter sp. G13]|uniref:DUF2306 domain-containing protein n=1 Tax=Pontibacter sp. G13 TaxID=3074898 RepID=UPI00288AE735|nr:DUF2306 domain-containing protein [Pontibacter sp. G13]WNJ20493.1 DUF2306 domain-containing protein [Pontibacter sp. G13]
MKGLRRIGKRGLGGLGVLMIVLTGVMIARRSIGYVPPVFEGFLHDKGSFFWSTPYFVAFFLHISVSPIILMLGLFQFSHSLQRRISLHRALGKTYVSLILLVSAPSAMVMALYATGGIWVNACFVLLSLGWWLSTWKGFQTIRQGHLEGHRLWMIRSYTLTTSAVWLRVFSFLLWKCTDLPTSESYPIAAWGSWLLPLILVECWLRMSPKSSTQAH